MAVVRSGGLSEYTWCPIFDELLYCLGQFCCCLHCLQTKKCDIAHLVIDMYIPTKFHDFISFGFLVMLVEQEDEQNSLS